VRVGVHHRIVKDERFHAGGEARSARFANDDADGVALFALLLFDVEQAQLRFVKVKRYDAPRIRVEDFVRVLDAESLIGSEPL
jgi:hypothetical protein